MPVNSEQTLISILQNKAIFFRLMDYAQSQASRHSMEFTISHYEALLRDTAQSLSDADKRRLLETLSWENLEYNGLLSYIDKRSGQFRLQDFVLEMLRHLDSKRLKELSSAELNQLIKQIEECHRQVSDASIIWQEEHDNFKEMVASVFDNLQNVASRLAANIRALQGQADRLASIVEGEKFSDLQRTEQVKLAFSEILRIHQRHVTPTLQFLDERLDIRRTRTELFGDVAPMALFKQIVDRFEQQQLPEYVTRLQRIHFQLFALGNKAANIARGLSRYVKYAEEERQRYNRIEELYSALREAVEDKQTGNLRDVLLNPNDAVFMPIRALGNFKSFNRAQSAKLNWPETLGTQALDEVLRINLAKPQSVSVTLSERAPISEETLQQRRTMERIIEAMHNYDYSQNSKDAYHSVHQHLQSTMADYSLPHLLDALSFLGANGRITLAESAKTTHIDYQGLRLRYRQRIYSASKGR